MQILPGKTEEEQGLPLCGLGFKPRILRLRDIAIIYNKPTRCNSGSIVFIKIYKYALHISEALCVHLQEHYKL